MVQVRSGVTKGFTFVSFFSSAFFIFISLGEDGCRVHDATQRADPTLAQHFGLELVWMSTS